MAQGCGSTTTNMYTMCQDETPNTEYHPQIRTCNNISHKLTIQHVMVMLGQQMHIQNCTCKGMCQHSDVGHQGLVVLNLVKLG